MRLSVPIAAGGACPLQERIGTIIWSALTAAPNGASIGRCSSISRPDRNPEHATPWMHTSRMTVDVGVSVVMMLTRMRAVVFPATHKIAVFVI